MTTALLVELPTEEALRRAIEKVRELGYRGLLDAFTPYAVEGIDEALGLRRPPVSAIVSASFAVGGISGYLIQRWCNAVAYAINVGGRPDEAAPPFAIITMVTAVLVASFMGFFMLVVWSRLPKLYQPIFQVEGFDRASLDRFWLGMDAAHATFDHDRFVRELEALGAERVATVTQEGLLT